MRALFVCALIATLTTMSYGFIQDRNEPRLTRPSRNIQAPQDRQRAANQPVQVNQPAQVNQPSLATLQGQNQRINRNNGNRFRHSDDLKSTFGQAPRNFQQKSNQNQFFNQTAPRPADGPNNPMQANFFRGDNGTQRKIDTKLREYRAAEKDEQKQKIESEIKELLNQQFDEKMRHPVQRVEESRKRLDDLQQQIKQRDQKSDEIIDLRVTVLTNQAIGLGWATNSSSHKNSFLFSRGQNTWSYPTQISGQLPRIEQAPRPSNPLNAQSWPVPHNSQPRHPDNRLTQSPNQRLPSLPNVSQPGQANRDRSDRQVSVNQLLADFKNAKDDSERKPIVKALRERLVIEFNNHQKQLKQKADQIDKSIADLESNIEKRKKAKASIVDLKLRTVINQANGLGF